MDFDASATNGAALIQGGDVTFDLDGHEYEVNQLGVCQAPTFCTSSGPVVLRLVHGTVEANSSTVESEIRVAAGGKLFSGGMTVGEYYGGGLEISDGGLVVSSLAVLGYIQFTQGHALIDGNGSRWLLGELTLGCDGDGCVRVQNGGALSTYGAVFSATTLSVGSGYAEISGVGSTWIDSGDLVLGVTNGGHLRVDDGGLATTTNALMGIREFEPFNGTEGDGSVHVDGPGSIFRASEAMVLGGNIDQWGGQYSDDAGGRGFLWVANGGQVAVGYLLRLGNGSDVSLEGGGVDVGSISATALANEVHVHEPGFLAGAGSILGSVRLDGKLDAGGAAGLPASFLSDSARLLAVDGDLTVGDSANLIFDIAGPPGSGAGAGYDGVEVTGTAQLGGELVVNVSAPIASGLGPNDVFTVLTAVGLSGSFDNVASGGWIPEAKGLGSFHVFYGPGSPFGANVVALSGFDPAPEPAQVLLVLTGGLVLAAARRKRRT